MLLNTVDPTIAAYITKEEQRQEAELSLIASENYVSQAVKEATASCLTNKYAEGYPNKRYYAGCRWVDEVENIAIARCKKLFNVEYVNVQPHAGCQANMAAYTALLNPGDTILGLNLAAGGHLTHGHPVNFSGKYFKAIQYGVNKESELFDYNEIADLAQKHKPRLLIVGASAYSRTIDFSAFKAIADSVGAFLLADIAHIAGLIAVGLHPSPVGIADVITSTTHKTLRGPRGGLIMSSSNHAEIINRAIIPGIQGGPLMHVIAAKAVGFYEALQPSFACYQQQTISNAQTMANEFKKLGYRIVSDGTDNHLFIIDLRTHSINGLEAQLLLEQVGVTSSRSCIPFDPEKPWITSGIRFGTPGITTRGMKEPDVIELAHLINELILHKNNQEKIELIKNGIKNLSKKFPIPSLFI